jgi:hypothetical protein
VRFVLSFEHPRGLLVTVVHFIDDRGFEVFILRLHFKLVDFQNQLIVLGFVEGKLDLELSVLSFQCL